MTQTQDGEASCDLSWYRNALKLRSLKRLDTSSRQQNGTHESAPAPPDENQPGNGFINGDPLNASSVEREPWDTPSSANQAVSPFQLDVTGPDDISRSATEQELIPRPFDNIRGSSPVQDQDQTLHVHNEVDDAYSEAEQSNLERGSVTPSWAGGKRFGALGSDSDGRDRGVLAYGDEDDIYDSDLDSEVSKTHQVVREHHKKMRKWRSLAKNRFEAMLLECIVNIDQIPPKYENIVVAQSVIDKLENVTRLSLNRPKAFSHGVLKGNRVTGAVLYGPPGTGKTLLAKAVAKESGFNMLAISTAELWQKCHGEDEKVIKAVFSMGRKLFPCIVFLDEADAMLGARKAGEKRHIRGMLNQFLMEWDGLTSGMDSPFMLLATNRPFDLDPAVLRRAPVQIGIDVPSPAARKMIIERLLRGETMGPDVNYVMLAQYTHRYTGSDLKNLCVTAATTCVSEQQEDTDKRILMLRHFRQALEIIKPTSLTVTMRDQFKKFEVGAHHDSEVHGEE